MSDEASPDAEQAAREQPAARRKGGRVVTIGWLVVAALAILDLTVIAIGGSNACGPTPNPVGGWGFLVLLLVPLGLVADGITALVAASRAESSEGLRRGFRTLGVISLALALVSVPVDFFAGLSWAMCF